VAIDIRRERLRGIGEVQHEPWSAYCCPARQCYHEVWYIQADALTAELWNVGEEPEQSNWQVAASTPICPRCATPLVPIDVGPKPNSGPFVASPNRFKI
jgi:hypothetical protein